MKLVVVTWEDATELDATPWTHEQEVEYTPLLVTQCGFVLYDGPEGLVLTSAYAPDIVARKQQIPRGMIVKIEELSYGV